ncbi:unnamed protein product [Acanthoscelides obtectus]|uniref:Uncharacterized protein n=1 Tax=Acanthoscelides obtectus TaxID=200917 RepID=A0A9P0L0Q9_ACAOB|nr:unnamed protein product [Acanthoscelides obtectus]CAH2011219.1 unnamed protein product [Acanthoscelides obtectus]CAK1679735.1 hypothetical protein AOBTE_LOCUS32422 [Acanthoscelides obtectus]CAK1679767.1 hypothetical protein AOBTE_LOCUS32429 [Acanthoscelides obtectus]
MKYSRLRKVSAPKSCDIQEPERKTLYDRIKDNFKQINRATYLHRVIYVGDHSIPVRDKYGSFLPEQEILLESKLTMTLKKYHSLYALVPQSDIFKDKVWPVPGDFIPFAVFSSPYDMATEMPAPEAASEKQEVGSEPIEESSSEEHT